VSPGISQVVIYARGDDGTFSLHKHSGLKMRGGQSIDFASGESVTVPKRSGPITLMLHAGLMSVAWGAFLPLGAVVARRFRSYATWIFWHKTLQMVGWLLQAVGFLMAILYIEEHSSHFQSPHTFIGLFIVVIGSLQPVNGLLRPHKPEAGEAKSQTRVAWERIHKGLGWLVIALGILNVLTGCMILAQKGYNSTTVMITAIIAAVSILAPVFALVRSFSLPTK